MKSRSLYSVVAVLFVLLMAACSSQSEAALVVERRERPQLAEMAWTPPSLRGRRAHEEGGGPAEPDGINVPKWKFRCNH